MTDNSNGTYSYNFTITNSGKITILVYLEPPHPVYFKIWWNLNLYGTECDSYYYSDINNYWASGNIASNHTVQISAKYTTYLIPPINDTYTIYFEHDDGGRVYINGVLKIDNWNSVSVDHFTINLIGGNYYSIIVDLNDFGGVSYSYLSWEYTGQTKTIIPQNWFAYHEYVNNTPLTVTVYPSWGDKTITINEECDDGNTNNGDWWSSQWKIEDKWLCEGTYDSR